MRYQWSKQMRFKSQCGAIAEEQSSAEAPLEVLYRDEYIVAINKPPGLLVHRSPIDRHETTFAVQTLRDQLGQYVYPAHRLDRPTSGVLVFSFSSKVAALLGEQMMLKQVKKEYHIWMQY